MPAVYHWGELLRFYVTNCIGGYVLPTKSQLDRLLQLSPWEKIDDERAILEVLKFFSGITRENGYACVTQVTLDEKDYISWDEGVKNFCGDECEVRLTKKKILDWKVEIRSDEASRRGLTASFKKIPEIAFISETRFTNVKKAVEVSFPRINEKDHHAFSTGSHLSAAAAAQPVPCEESSKPKLQEFQNSIDTLEETVHWPPGNFDTLKNDYDHLFERNLATLEENSAYLAENANLKKANSRLVKQLDELTLTATMFQEMSIRQEATSPNQFNDEGHLPQLEMLHHRLEEYRHRIAKLEKENACAANQLTGMYLLLSEDSLFTSSSPEMEKVEESSRKEHAAALVFKAEAFLKEGEWLLAGAYLGALELCLSYVGRS